MRAWVSVAAILIIALALVPAASANEYDSYTTHMLHMNGTAGTPASLDAINTSWNPRGGVYVDQNVSILGTGSGRFNSATAADINAMHNSQLDNWGTGDFTIEWRMNTSDYSVDIPIIERGTASSDYSSVFITSGNLYLYFVTGSTYRANYNSALPSLPMNKWNSFAIQRNGSTCQMFVNGTLISTTTTTAFNGALDSLNVLDMRVGNTTVPLGGTFRYNGYFDEIRFSKGIARYGTPGYTVPSFEFGGSGTTPIAIVPNFTANQTENSRYGMAVKFTNITTQEQITAWNWSFGNGSVPYTSKEQSPTVLFKTAGRYNINATFINTSAMQTNVNLTYYINLTSDFDNNLLSRIQFTGVSGSNYIFGTAGPAWTASDVTISSTQSKFNGTAGAFLSPGSFITTPTNPGLNLGAGNFTIEQWIYPVTTGSDYVVVSRSTSTTLANGWGLYHGSGAGSNDWHFYMGDRAANATAAFTLPLNQWSKVDIERVSGTITVYVNGQSVATRSQPGPYDVAAPLVYGDPGVGLRSFDGYLDETSISNEARFWSNYVPNFEQYKGALFVQNPNPGAIFRFKTASQPYPSGAMIANLTARNRTFVIDKVNITNNISTTLTYDPQHLYVKRILANASTFDAINFTYWNIDPVNGIVTLNLTRPNGFSPGEQPASVADIEMIYYNYSENQDDVQFFGDGHLKNATTGLDFPVTQYIGTNVSYLDWITFSNFTVTARESKVNKPTFFIPLNNFTADKFIWTYGDGTVENTTLRKANHTYMAVGDYDVICTAINSWNTSVRNTSLIHFAVNVTLADDSVAPDFLGYPTTGSPSLSVKFTDLSVVANKTAVNYNWSFGDGSYSQTVGDVTHVYQYAGAFTVNLSITNTAKSDTGMTVTSNYYERKDDYIIVSNQQQYTPEQRQVRFLVVDRYNRPLPGVDVYANVTGTTLGSTEWLTDLFGISSSLDPYISNATLSGITGADGGIAFTMVPSLYYNLEFKNSSAGIQHSMNIYPNQLDYVIVVSTTDSAPVAEKYNYVNHSLTTHDFGATVSLNFSYNDTVDPSTTSLTFFVNYPNYTPVYSVTYPDTLYSNRTINGSYTVTNTAGNAYVWGIYATNTAFGNINQSKGITLNGNGPLIDLFTFRSSW